MTGPRVHLRNPQPDDLRARQHLGWHEEIERGYGKITETRPMSDDEAHAWYDHRVAVADDSDRCEWLIDVAGSLAGITFLHSISATERNARFAIGLYAPTFLGQGFGAEATGLVLRHAFTTIGLHRVDLRVLAFNSGAIASYRRCGFREEGRMRETALIDGTWHDDIIMSVLASDFDAATE